MLLFDFVFSDIYSIFNSIFNLLIIILHRITDTTEDWKGWIVCYSTEIVFLFTVERKLKGKGLFNERYRVTSDDEHNSPMLHAYGYFCNISSKLTESRLKIRLLCRLYIRYKIIFKYKLNTKQILLIMKYTTTHLKYPPMLWRNTKTQLIDLEYEIQHCHTSLLVPGNSYTSQQDSCK